MATQTIDAQDIPKKFELAGFEVTKIDAGKLQVRKSGCVAYLENRDGRWSYTGTPYLLDHGLECELEDRGYQKFWYCRPEEKRFPIRKVELEVFHRFDEEVRKIAGAKALYNESLGSVNARTVYDRLEGRPDR